jgi:hypothetical protein
MLRVFENPMPEDSFIEMKELVLMLRFKQLDDIIEQ